ncbi:MAG: phenylacetate-CoA oxygenase subunit PaaI [Phycisphaerales bacterium]|nr:phenylacetate-CoA oxygenase subunit PaaI [Phycisphaerales bacterium]
MEAMLTNPLAVLILAHADDKLLLGHVQSDWTGLGPLLEEDIAASAMAQDDLSHALILYQFLGERYELDSDVIAFEREPVDYMCCDLVTKPDEFDWAEAVVKRWLIAEFTGMGIDRLSAIEDKELAARCNRIKPEQALQIKHLQAWIKRLGTAGPESQERIQAALDRLSGLAGMLFEVPGQRLPVNDDFCCGRDEMFKAWDASIQETLSQSNLKASFALPERSLIGGRRGTHASHFHDQFDELTEVRRVSPGASW